MVEVTLGIEQNGGKGEGIMCLQMQKLLLEASQQLLDLLSESKERPAGDKKNIQMLIWVRR